MAIEENDAAYLRKARAKVIHGSPGRTDDMKVVSGVAVNAIAYLVSWAESTAPSLDEFTKRDVTAVLALIRRELPEL